MALLTPPASACRLTRSEARRSVVSCRATQDRQQPLEAAKAAAVGVLLAASLCVGEAGAKVILEKPTVKKFYQADSTPAAPKGEAQSGGGGISLPSISAPKLSAPSIGLPSLDLGVIAIPGAIAAIFGGGFLLTKVDPGFGDMMNETIIKDCGDYAGYEEVLKSDADLGKKSKTGTKAIKASRGPQAKPGNGSGTGFSLPKLPGLGSLGK